MTLEDWQFLCLVQSLLILSLVWTSWRDRRRAKRILGMHLDGLRKVLTPSNQE